MVTEDSLLTHDERKAAEAAFRALPLNPPLVAEGPAALSRNPSRHAGPGHRQRRDSGQ